ncbi:MAG: TIGR02253 family HAD-type hydrolase [Anaerolineales bacterium]
MTSRAVFFDFGGVILRTEFQAPRQQLAERFHLEYEELDRAVFNCESAKRASLGEISEAQHWLEVAKRFKLPASEAQAFQDAFFGGDVIDRALVNFIRDLRRRGIHTGLISNAWSGLRAYMEKEKILDAFDSLTISAEARVVKPSPEIYRLALQKAQASNAIFVDDFPENIAACQQLGWTGILFRDSKACMEKISRLVF